MDHLLADVRYALRRFRREPAFAAAAILTIGLAVGLNTAIFSVTNAVLLRPLPYADPDRLVLAGKGDPSDPNPWGLSDAEYYDWLERNRVFAGMAAAAPWQFDLLTADSPEPLDGEKITASLLPLLGVKPILGRNFLPDEETAGQDKVVILGEAVWRRMFGADPHIVGRQIRLQEYSGASAYQVVGVAPSGFRLRYRTTAGAFQSRPRKGGDLYVPLVPGGYRGNTGNRKTGSYSTVYARLKPGVPFERARREVYDLQEQLKREFPASARRWVGVLRPLHEAMFGSTRPAVLLLTVAVALVLLIGCTNVASLLLARGAGRRQELAVRAALGSGRLRLFQQLLTENFVLAATGGAIGLLVAVWLTRIAGAIMPPEFARGDDIPIDRTVLLFTIAVSLATGALFGLVPAWRASRAHVIDALKVGAATTDRGSGRLHNALVAIEVFIVLVLCSAAGLMLNSLWRLARTELGFDMQHVMTMMLRVPNDMGSDFKRRMAFDATLLARVRLLPGVLDASTTSDLPFSSGGLVGFTLPSSARPHWAEVFAIDPHYLSLIHLPIVRGRGLTAADQRGPRVAVINQATADKYFPGADPIGQHLLLRDDYEIVGIVGNHREMIGRDAGVRASRLRDDADTQAIRTTQAPAVYVPSAQAPWHAWLFYLVVRTGPNTQAVAHAIRREINEIQPNLAVKDTSTFDDWVAMSTSSSRFYTTVLTIFSLVALALAAVGIYGVLAQAVGQRVREIGIRLALGATAPLIVRAVLVQTMVLVGLGVAAGLVGSWMTTRLIRSYLFDVAPTDPTTLTVAALVLVLVAIGAAWLPARRATRIDPMQALRCE